MPDERTRFCEHLTKQLEFLKRSSASFDSGHTDEAIRIAVVIRVLVHNSRSSTSLLRHLRATAIPLTSTCEGAGPATLSYFGLGMCSVTSRGPTFEPMLSGGPVS